MHAFYAPSPFLVRVVFPVVAGVRRAGVEAVLPHGPLVIVARRQSRWDATALAAALPRPVVFWGGGWTAARVRPEWRGGLDRGVEMLRRDAALGVLVGGPGASPRSDGPSAIPAGMVGAALLALRASAPIMPVSIRGTEAIRLLRRPRVDVTFGQPFSLPMLEGPLSRATLRTLARMVVERLAAVRTEVDARAGGG